MHSHLPITPCVYAFAVHNTPVSVADAKDHTTCCNRVSLPAGGFQRHGLPGHAHTVPRQGSVARTMEGTDGSRRCTRYLEPVEGIDFRASTRRSKGFLHENSAKACGEKPGGRPDE